MPDQYFPGEFSLDDGPVEAVQTSETHPKIRLDATGVYATTPAGKKKSELDEEGVTLLDTIDGQQTQVKWERITDGGLLAHITAMSGSDHRYGELILKVLGKNNVGGGSFPTELSLVHAGPNGYSGINFSINHAGTPNTVQSGIIMDSTGKSSFRRAPVVQNLVNQSSAIFDGITNESGLIIRGSISYLGNTPDGTQVNARINAGGQANETHLDYSWNPGTAGGPSGSSVQVYTALPTIGRTYETVVSPRVSFEVMMDSRSRAGQSTFHGTFETRRTAGSYSHLGGRVGGWFEGANINKLELLFNGAVDGTVAVEAVDGKAL